jgi:hypothetical protein
VKWFRAVGAVAIVAALVLFVSHSSSSSRTFPPVVACNASAISAAYHQVDSVQSFGCAGQFAYLWATVGKGEGEIGVTEVAHYDPASSSWKNASRLHYCVDHRLPSYVQFWGCNSN